MTDKHVINEDPGASFRKEFGTGTEEAKDNSVILTLSGNTHNVDDHKFHGYDKNEKQNKY